MQKWAKTLSLNTSGLVILSNKAKALSGCSARINSSASFIFKLISLLLLQEKNKQKRINSNMAFFISILVCYSDCNIRIKYLMHKLTASIFKIKTLIRISQLSKRYPFLLKNIRIMHFAQISYPPFFTKLTKQNKNKYII